MSLLLLFEKKTYFLDMFNSATIMTFCIIERAVLPHVVRTVARVAFKGFVCEFLLVFCCFCYDFEESDVVV